MATDEPSVMVYRLHVLLLGVSPAVSRLLEVRSDHTIDDLHATIQLAMGWTDRAPHMFRIHGRWYHGRCRNAASQVWGAGRTPMAAFRLCERERFDYEYGFGACWRCQIRLKKVLPVVVSSRFPRCVGGRRSPPPETCGGAWQYMSDERRIRSLFEAGALIVEALDADQDDDAFRAEVTGIAEWSRCCLFDRRACNARLRAHFDDPAGNLVTREDDDAGADQDHR
ncbi:MAG: plasmid pRiA4b ORF-3 family protein [Parvibaculum sp.]